MNQQTKIEMILSQKSNTNLKDLKMSVKFLVLMAMLNTKNIEKKFDLMADTIVEYFNLESILEHDDINYIFGLVVDNKNDKIENVTLKTIQAFYLAFVLSIKNIELKFHLLDVLEEFTKLSDKLTDEEIIAKKTYSYLLTSESNQDVYQELLEKIQNHHSNYIYSKNGLKPEKFAKKVTKVLSSYAKDINKDDVISLYDHTVFGAADEGFIITRVGILTTQDEDISVIPFSSIFKVTYDNNGMTFYCVDENDNYLEMAHLTRYHNIRILANILNQFGAINKKIDVEEQKS